jgi:hypothetical protein
MGRVILAHDEIVLRIGPVIAIGCHLQRGAFMPNAKRNDRSIGNQSFPDGLQVIADGHGRFTRWLAVQVWLLSFGPFAP